MTHSAPDPKMVEYITTGKSAIIYSIDNERVLKEYFENDRRDVEFQAYSRLGSHPNIVRYLGYKGTHSIILERGEDIRTLYQNQNVSQISLLTKTRWIRQAAEGLQYIHQRGIIHADVGVSNMIIVNDCLKIIDFEGCSIDGKPADSCYQWFSYRPSPTVSIQTDIFAYGCAVYEIITGQPPYYEFETYPDRYVEQMYTAYQFPDVARLPLGELILHCWHGQFRTMDEVIQKLEASQRSTSKRGRKAVTWAAVSSYLVLLVFAM